MFEFACKKDDKLTKEYGGLAGVQNGKYINNIFFIIANNELLLINFVIGWELV